ncbi:MAG: FecR domain-containing protein [Candidatus Acidiferrales bacterium]
MNFKPKLLTRSLGCLAVAALISVPAWGSNTSPPDTAVPGTINYIEGEASIGSEALNSKSVGQVELKPGQSIDTKDGRAEVLLTPGVFLRLGHDSSAKMVSSSLINTKMSVTSGEATVEVDELHQQNNLMIGQGDSTSYLVHTGFYNFDPQQGLMRVVKGQAVVLRNDRHIRVNGGHQVNLAAESGQLKKEKFNESAYKKDNSLYRWSKLRSQYLAEANVNSAPYLYNGGFYGPGGWWGSGWYWNPWFSSYTFIPGSGVIYSPFGWGFYSPWDVGLAPYSVYGGGMRHFDRGFDSWGMRTNRSPYVPGHTRSFNHGRGFYGAHGSDRGGARNFNDFHGGGFQNRGFRGGFHGGFQGERGGRR